MALSDNAQFREKIETLVCAAREIDVCCTKFALPQWGQEWAQQAAFFAERPRIMVVGEVKSGKSTFANAMLGRNLFPRDVVACTARLCHVKPLTSHRATYRLLRRTASDDPLQPGSAVEFAGVTLPTEAVLTETNDRSEDTVLAVEVEIPGCPILQDGYDVVDSPGIGENEHLNDVVLENAKNAMVIVYVLNGKNGCVKERPDHLHLRKLLERVPREMLFFVVNRLDPPEMLTEKERRLQKKQASVTELAQEVYNGLAPYLAGEGGDVPPLPDCPRFFGPASGLQYLRDPPMMAPFWCKLEAHVRATQNKALYKLGQEVLAQHRAKIATLRARWLRIVTGEEGKEVVVCRTALEAVQWETVLDEQKNQLRKAVETKWAQIKEEVVGYAPNLAVVLEVVDGTEVARSESVAQKLRAEVETFVRQKVKDALGPILHEQQAQLITNIRVQLASESQLIQAAFEVAFTPPKPKKGWGLIASIPLLGKLLTWLAGWWKPDFWQPKTITNDWKVQAVTQCLDGIDQAKLHESCNEALGTQAQKTRQQLETTLAALEQQAQPCQAEEIAQAMARLARSHVRCLSILVPLLEPPPEGYTTARHMLVWPVPDLQSWLALYTYLNAPTSNNMAIPVGIVVNEESREVQLTLNAEGTLMQALAGGRPTKATMLKFILKLAYGLLDLHRAGYAHRSISADTVLVQGGTVLLGPFKGEQTERAVSAAEQENAFRSDILDLTSLAMELFGQEEGSESVCGALRGITSAEHMIEVVGRLVAQD